MALDVAHDRDDAVETRRDGDDTGGREKRMVFGSVSTGDTPTAVSWFPRPHAMPVTAVTVSSDGHYIYSASKDGRVCQWSFSGDRLLHFKLPRPARTQIYALALSFDDTILAAGGSDHHIYLWETAEGKHLKTLRHHRDAVTGLVFKKTLDDHILYSSSYDKTIKAWSVDELAYLDSLFGHESPILGVDALSREQCISAGALDHTARLWKVADQKHLLFKTDGKYGSLDCVALIDHHHFIAGTDTGTLLLWNTGQKRPQCQLLDAHGPGAGIVSVASLCYTDIAASGTLDSVCVWKIQPDPRSLQLLFSIRVAGYPNAMEFFQTRLVVGVGREMRLGRWEVRRDAENTVYTVSLT